MFIDNQIRFSYLWFHQKFCPDQKIRQWIQTLSEPFPDAFPARAVYVRHLLTDLCANGERRLRDHHYEDAVIRAYRTLELIGQARLFDKHLDSSSLPPDHPDVKAFQEELLADRSQEPLTKKKNKYYQAPREKVARLLKRMNDPLADSLLKLGKHSAGNLKLIKRNDSILIHGFESIAGNDAKPIKDLLKLLEEQIFLDNPFHAADWFAMARWLDFSRLERRDRPAKNGI